jgi:hypothetical protein
LRRVDEEQPFDPVRALPVNLLLVLWPSYGIVFEQFIDIIKNTQFITQPHGCTEKHPTHTITSPSGLQPALKALAAESCATRLPAGVIINDSSEKTLLVLEGQH